MAGVVGPGWPVPASLPRPLGGDEREASSPFDAPGLLLPSGTEVRKGPGQQQQERPSSPLQHLGRAR